MKKKRFVKLNKLLEIPLEVFSDEPKITCLSFKKIMIENYKNILVYQDVFIKISSSIGNINISGLDLTMEEMNNDDIIVEGMIESIEFEKNAK